MPRHLLRVVPQPQKPRPAKVVQLEARRKARLERAQPAPEPPLRPAA